MWRSSATPSSSPRRGGALSVTGNFTGTGSVTHAGPGPLILTGASTHTGGTTLLGGFLTLGGASGTATGSGGLTIAIPSGWPNSGSVELATNQTVGVVHFTGADYGAVHTQGHNLSTAGLYSTGGKGVVENRAANQPDPAGNATVFINVAPASTYSFDGFLRDGYDPTATTLAVVKNGTGIQVFTGNNISYAGGTTINAGILRAGSNSALGATGGSVLVNSGGTLDLAAAELWNYTQPITVNGSGAGGIGAIYKSSTNNGSLLQLRSIVLGSDASIGGVAGARIDIGRGDWTGPAGAAPLHIDGQGHTLSVTGGVYLAILADAQNLAGVVVGTGASIAPHNDNSMGSALVNLNGGTLTPWNTHTFANNIVVTANGGFIDNQGYSQTYTGTLQLGGATQINTIGGGNISLNGNASGNGSVSKVGSAALVVSGNNTQTGTLTVNGGNVYYGSTVGHATNANTVLDNPGSFLLMQVADQFGPNAGLIFSASGGHKEFALYGHDQTIASLSSANQFAVVQNSHGNIGPAAASATLTVNQSTDTTYSGYSRDNTGNDAFILGLTKSGAGSLTLSGGTVFYTGATAVSGGQLVLFNTTNYNSPTTVSSGAKLSWSGNTDLPNGTTASVTLNSGSTLENLNPANWTVTNGAVTAAGSVTINHTSNATGAAGVGFYLDGGIHGTGTITINTTNASSGVNLRNNNSTFSGTLIVNGIASATPFAGSGIGVGGATTALQNADITLNGTMELLNNGLGWANGAAGAFRMGALNGTGTMVGNYTGVGAVTTVTIGATNNAGTFSGTIAEGVGNTVQLVKTGTGAQTLSRPLTYTGTTTISDGTLNVYRALGAGANVVNANGGQTNFYASQTLAALNIGAGAEVTFGDGLAFAPAAVKFDAPALVPEPGAIGLLLSGALGLAARRRRRGGL